MNTARKGNYFSEGRAVKMLIEDDDAQGVITQIEDTICKAADEFVAAYIVTCCAFYERTLRRRQKNAARKTT